MSTETKKVKAFNKLYKEFQVNLLKSLKRNNEKVHSVKRPQQLHDFNKQIEENIELYNSKDENLFTKVLLLKRIFFGKPKLNQTNLNITWNYIKIFYTISSGKIETNNANNNTTTTDSSSLLQNFGLTSSQMSGVVSELVNSKNTGLQNLVKDLSSQFSGLDDNVDPKQIIDAIMNPDKENSLGIDFRSIIESTSKKISSGEIDISSIKDALSKK